METLRTDLPKRRYIPDLAEKQEETKAKSPSLTVQTETEAQIQAALKCGISRLYVPAEQYAKYKDSGREIVACLPAVCRAGDRPVEAERVLVSNIGQVKAYQGKSMYGGFRLNIYNSASCDFFKAAGNGDFIAGINLGEIHNIASPVQKEVIVYGRLPLMVMQNCPVRAAGNTCQNGKQIFALKDRKNEVFPVLCGEGCLAVLYNAKPVYMADKMKDLLGIGADSLRLMFTTETERETERIIKRYLAALAGEIVSALPENTFTRGHFYRGVE